MLTAIIVAATLQAAPINLECQLSGSSGQTPADAPWDWTLTIYESEGRVVQTNPNATVEKRAIISASMVRMPSSTGEISVDRTTLAFRRTITLGGGEMVTDGRCRVARPVRRAF